MAIKGILGFLFKLFPKPEPSGLERPSPSDILPFEAIKVDGSKLIVDYSKILIPLSKPPKVIIVGIADTGSMDPVVDMEHNVPMIMGTTQDCIDLKNWLFAQPPGNLIAFSTYEGNIFHRVVAVMEDTDGEYLVTKGDNNKRDDPYRVKRENILYISTGSIY